MGRINLAIYTTLDGVVESPEKWSFPYFNDELAQYQQDLLFGSEAQLLGRVTYEAFAASWPGMRESTGEFGAKMNDMPKYVASETLNDVEWNSTLLRGDVIDEVRRLKQGRGDLLIYGSPGLCQTLMAANLIDVYHLMVSPVIVGQGKRLFYEDSPRPKLKTLGAKQLESGTVILTYGPE